MKKRIFAKFAVSLSLILSAHMAAATTYPISLTKLTGITGGSPSATAVYRADLSSIDATLGMKSLTLMDNSSGFGGAAGQFSGFDLDAIIFSNNFIADAGIIATASSLNLFNYEAGSIFTPGTQRVPVDPKLFGTGVLGNTVDNNVATLGSFDGNSTTAIPGAFGFLSMGDKGILSLNFNSILYETTSLFLYIGEVGDNGEVAASSIFISDNAVVNPVNPVNPVPEPTTMLLFGTGIAGLVGSRIRRKK